MAEFAELVALGLEAGLPPGDAAELAIAAGGAGRPPDRSLARLREAVTGARAEGTSIGAALAQAGDGPDPAGRAAAATAAPLAFLGAAWSLTDDLGAPAAGAARTCAAVLRARAAAEARRRVVAAGPHASMWLLTLLPLAGPLVGVVLGLPLGVLYGRRPAALSALAGVLLTGVGWAWGHAVLRRAARPRALRG